MKITAVECYPVWGGGRNFLFVVVDPDEGISAIDIARGAEPAARPYASTPAGGPPRSATCRAVHEPAAPLGASPAGAPTPTLIGAEPAR